MFAPGDLVQSKMGGPKLKVIEAHEDSIARRFLPPFSCMITQISRISQKSNIQHLMLIKSPKSG